MVETHNGTRLVPPFTSQCMTGYDDVCGRWWLTWNDPITDGPNIVRMISRQAGAGTEIFEMHAPGPTGRKQN